MAKEVDWAAHALNRPKILRARTRSEVEAKPPVAVELDVDCEHVFVPGKKHCRLCGERELSVWLDKMNGLK